MKIVLINRHLEDVIGGSELQCDFIANELTSRGYSVYYITPNGNCEIEDSKYSYKILTCNIDGADIVDKVIEADPDIVYWRYNKNHVRFVLKKLKQKKYPIIFAASHINDLRPWILDQRRILPKRIKYAIKKRIEHFALRYADAITVNNEDFISLVPSYVKFKEYIPNGMVSEHVPFYWKLPFCVWVANIKQPKRPELFVKLAEELKDCGMDFIMVGHIQQDNYNWIKNVEHTPNNFYYIGPKTFEEVNGILHASEFHVHTCIPEGFPNIFIQAWLNGKATVSYGFDPGGLIEKEGLGFVSDENWEFFVDFVRQMIGKEKMRNEIGKKAKAFSRQRFSVQHSTDKLQVLIQKVMESQGKIFKVNQ